ncbi:rhodanese-related sulfurtransferase [Candidatus Endowatersipora endosymbiont of Watersipora subatra]|uniref:oxygen-dependent tRNA uridine(34) hydroxylase TrhO n=1 Tax=Candidatus Endowatersipora endosymbiont of Watersipora subatra TaxID=3077946 RepID=UPI00312C72DB
MIVSFYNFFTLHNPSYMQHLLIKQCEKHDVVGTILLAPEGINGTISGYPYSVRSVLKYLEVILKETPFDIKISWNSTPPFHRIKVRLKKEIITLGIPNIDVANQRGNYVDPKYWNNFLQDSDVFLVDTRNAYEVAIGTFKGALNPNTRSFREFPEWVDKKFDANKDSKIALFCTGGIRCEKSIAFLKSRGYSNLFYLKGGILKYLEDVPKSESLWKGECFVFDQRVSVDDHLNRGSYEMCYSCKMPLRKQEQLHKDYKIGISCPHCIQTLDEKKGRIKHIAVNLELAKAKKKRSSNNQCCLDIGKRL